MSHKRTLSLAIAVTLSALMPPVAHAGIARNFTGAIDANWDTAGNWTPTGVPVSGDTATLVNASVYRTGNLSGMNVKFGNSVLNFTGNTTIAGSLFSSVTPDYYYGNQLQLNGDGATTSTLTIAADTTLMGGYFSIGTPYVGAWDKVATVNNGKIQLNQSYQFTQLVNVTNNSGALIQATNNNDLNFVGLFGKSLNKAGGTITMSGGNLYLLGDLVNDGTVKLANTRIPEYAGSWVALAGTGTYTLTNCSLGAEITLRGVNLSYNALSLQATRLLISGNQTLGANGVVNSNHATDASQILLDSSQVTPSLLTIGAATTLTGRFSSIGDAYIPRNAGGDSSKVATVNNGKILLNASGTTTSITNLTNNGTLATSNGNHLVLNRYIAGPTVNSVGATITLNTGSDLVLGTYLENNGTVTLNGANLYGAGSQLSGTGNYQFNSARIRSDLNLLNTKWSGTTSDLDSVALTVRGTQTALVNGTWRSNGTSASRIGLDAAFNGGSRLTIGSGATLVGKFTNIGYAVGPNALFCSVVNNGRITLDAAQNSTALDNLVNNGVVETRNGNGLTFGSSSSKNVNNKTVTASNGITIFSDYYNNTGATTAVTTGGMSVYGNIVNDGIMTINGAITSGYVSRFAGSGTYTLNTPTLQGIVFGGSATTNINSNVVLTDTLTIADSARVTVGGNLQADNKDIWIGPSAALKVTVGATLNSSTVHLAGGGSLTYGNMTLNDSDIRIAGNATLNNNITFTGTGLSDVLFENGANTLTIGSGATLSGRIGAIGRWDSSASNRATAVVNNGRILSNVSGQSIRVHNLTNKGTLQAVNNSTILLNTDTGTTLNQGAILIDSGSTLGISSAVPGIRQTGGQTIMNGLLVASGDIGQPGNVAFELSGGTLGGTGYVYANVINNGGTFTPGNPVGRMTLMKNYQQTDAGKMLVELGGTIAGARFDFVSIAGFASLDGGLQISLLNGFTPTVGQTFDFLLANGGIFGQFASVQSLVSGYGYSYSTVNNTTGRLTVTAAPVGPGASGLLNGIGGPVVVPEAGALPLLLTGGTAGFALLAFRRRK